MTTSKTIHIVGAGIGGLTTALALNEAGHEVRVTERMPGLSEVGAGITLWPNAIRVFDRLGSGLGARIRAAGRGHEVTSVANSRGRTLSTATFGPAEPLVGVHRGILQRAIFDALPDGTVGFGLACSSVRTGPSGVTVEFEDGTSTTSEIVIGADGLNSAVRSTVFGHRPLRYHGYTAFRGLLDDWPDRQPMAGEVMGLGRRFGIMPIGNGQLYWYGTNNQAEHASVDQADRQAFVAERFAGWGLDIPEIIARTAPDAILQHDVRDLPPSRGWSKGPIVLIGDAIHPTSPNLGQGAAMAIEDGPVLARALATRPDPATAFAAFEEERAVRTARVTKLSARIGRAGQSESRAMCLARDTAIRLLPTSVRAKQSGWLSDFDTRPAPAGALS